MGKKKRADEMVQASIRMPRSMADRLKTAGGERRMNEEIRRRLDESFAKADESAIDPKTERLADLICRLANAIAIDAPWYEDHYSFQMFKAGIDALLAKDEPPRDAVPKHRLLFGGPSDQPETVGKTLLASMLRDLPKQKFAEHWESDQTQAPLKKDKD